MLRRSFLSFCCVLALGATGAAQAQSNYPSRPIRMVVGFPPGGISDVLARTVAAEASAVLGQSIVVENRPGAGTTIASDTVARSAADGYTLLFQDLTTHAINASLYKKLPFDTLEDFTPVALVSSSPLMLVVNANSPAKTVADLMARGKGKEGALTYGSSGNGTIIHLASEMMDRASGVKSLHVPYKGSAPLVQALFSGEIDFAFSSMPPAVSQVAAGRLRALAVSTPDRVDVLPDVPTIAQAGVPAAEVVLYNGVLAPRDLPADVLAKLSDAFSRAVQSEKLKATYKGLGAKPMAVSPEKVREQIREDVTRYAKVVKEVGVQID
ncbi:Bug family tripartite tricarboxylate transporter substrate binding protein [Bordetella genomosp. 13]|uniref:Bug family tripartite tricarboxylate transporter substrate binding protein n=1 Tax=Bordetella genomosp. 13 TaxID=463040 RepID=UPI0011AA5340|nr:tripartite tricarboxylate transporter substrate binding protein [Bordetella genomosp. 13]